MYISDPKHTMSMIKSGYDRTDDGTHFLLRSIREGNKHYLDNLHLVPSEERYVQAAETMSDMSELMIGAEDAKKLFDLYPSARINLAESGVDKEDCSFILAHFFMGCRWPQFGDKMDIDEFVEELKKQAVLIGFKARC